MKREGGEGRKGRRGEEGRGQRRKRRKRSKRSEGRISKRSGGTIEMRMKDASHERAKKGINASPFQCPVVLNKDEATTP